MLSTATTSYLVVNPFTTDIIIRQHLSDLELTKKSLTVSKQKGLNFIIV